MRHPAWTQTFTAAQVRRIVETMDVIVLPQVNPDGRHFSMEHHPMWRKNRRPAPPGRGPKSIGVDLNRNFPFLWNFARYFAPDTVQNSCNPGDYETYIGPRAASEPETRNVIWLLNHFRNIRYSSISTAMAKRSCTAGATPTTSPIIRR